MKHLLMIAFVVLTLMPTSSIGASSQAARSDRIAVAGEIQFAPIVDAAGQPYVIETPIEGNKCLVHVLGSYTFYGSIEGSGTAFLTVRSHGPCGFPPFTFAEDGDIYGTVSGSVAGRTGTFNYHYTFQLDKTDNWRGRIEIVSGTDQLANLRGTLNIVSTDTAVRDPYTGWVSFDN
jgi:hypothetical protein